MDGSIFSDPESPFSSSSAILSDKQKQSPSYQRSRSFFSPSRSPCTSPTPRPHEGPFSRQNRRLQLRNAGFRGGLLSNPRSISPQLVVWKSSSGSVCDDNKENGGGVEDEIEAEEDIDKRPNASRRKRTGVLQELRNSTQRRKPRAPRPLVSTFFQELQQDGSTDADIASGSFFDNNSRPKTPLLEPFSPETTMRPKDPSSFVPRVPSTGLNRQKRQPSSARTVSHGTSRYIEHLETQLAASLDCTNSVNSPMGNTYATKYKALNAEHRVLKQELAEWEERFEDRVQQEINVMIGRESQLRSKIRTFERELETKSNKIRELEWEAEVDRQRLRSLESVNSTNRSLEKRVDVLTGILAQSPTKSEQEPRADMGFETVSADDEATHRTPRPRSMFSRIPLSPVRRPLFQPTSIPEPSPQLDDEPARGEIPELDISYRDEMMKDRPVSELMSLDSGLGGSCSSPSTRPQGSQRSSMISHSSGSSIWGTSFPLPLEIPRRHRGMRRFPSGSCTLKPLVLPITSSLVSPSSLSYQSDNVDYSAGHSRTFSTNEWHSPSNFVHVHEETLDALEGNTNQYQSFAEAISGHALSDIADMSGEDGAFDQEFDTSPFPDGHLHPRGFFDTPTRNPYLHREPSKRLHSHGVAGDSRSPASLAAVVHGGPYHGRMRFLDRDHSSSPEIMPLMARQSAAVGPGSDLAVKGTFACSSWFRDIVSGSMILAKRILFNSWHSNWKRIGKFPWWVLGLILGVPRRNQWLKRCARSEIVGHLPLYRCASEMVTQNGLGDADEGGTKTAPCHAITRLSIQDLRNQSQSDICILQDCEWSSHSSHSPVQPSFSLWAKFSLAIALAIGLAIKDGPASLMCSCSIEAAPDDTRSHLPMTQEPDGRRNEPGAFENTSHLSDYRESD